MQHCSCDSPFFANLEVLNLVAAGLGLAIGLLGLLLVAEEKCVQEHRVKYTLNEEEDKWPNQASRLLCRYEYDKLLLVNIHINIATEMCFHIHSTKLSARM